MLWRFHITYLQSIYTERCTLCICPVINNRVIRTARYIVSTSLHYKWFHTFPSYIHTGVLQIYQALHGTRRTIIHGDDRLSLQVYDITSLLWLQGLLRVYVYENIHGITPFQAIPMHIHICKTWELR